MRGERRIHVGLAVGSRGWLSGEHAQSKCPQISQTLPAGSCPPCPRPPRACELRKTSMSPHLLPTPFDHQRPAGENSVNARATMPSAGYCRPRDVPHPNPEYQIRSIFFRRVISCCRSTILIELWQAIPRLQISGMQRTAVPIPPTAAQAPASTGAQRHAHRALICAAPLHQRSSLVFVNHHRRTSESDIHSNRPQFQQRMARLEHNPSALEVIPSQRRNPAARIHDSRMQSHPPPRRDAAANEVPQSSATKYGRSVNTAHCHKRLPIVHPLRQGAPQRRRKRHRRHVIIPVS